MDACSAGPRHRDSAMSCPYCDNTYGVFRETLADTTTHSTFPIRNSLAPSAMARSPPAQVASSLVAISEVPNRHAISEGNVDRSTVSNGRSLPARYSATAAGLLPTWLYRAPSDFMWFS
jgi:hypothetical protein